MKGRREPTCRVKENIIITVKMTVKMNQHEQKDYEPEVKIKK